MSKFTYQGIEIGFDANGKFFATVNGLDVRKPSLDAMKKHIDNAAKVEFKPFTALAEIRYNEKPIRGAPNYTRVEVVGIVKASARYSDGKSAFVTKRDYATGGSGTAEEYRTIYEDTPHNLAALLNEEVKKEAKRKAIEKLDAEITAVQKTQKRLDPNKFKRAHAKGQP